MSAEKKQALARALKYNSKDLAESQEFPHSPENS
jgi:hypothetical protein